MDAGQHRVRRTGRADSVRVEYALPAQLTSAHWARLLTAGFLTGPRATKQAREQLDEAQLVVSELVTNAVRHGRTRCRLRLTAHQDEVTVEVTDSGPGAPVRGEPEARRESGRGLLLVHHLTRRLHTTRHAHGGKTVRAVLA